MLPATLTFDCPTADALVDYLAAEVFSEELASGSAAVPASATHHATPSAEDDGTLDELSENDLASLLEARLDGIASRKGTTT